MKNLFTLKAIGFLGIIIALILLINYNVIISAIIDYLEQSLSSDGELSIKSIYLFHILYSLLIIIVSFISISFILNFYKKIFEAVTKFFQLQVNPSNNFNLPKHFNLYVLIIGTATAILQFVMLIIYGEPANASADLRSEGFLEKIFAVILFISLIFIFISIKNSFYRIEAGSNRKKILIPLFLLALFVFVFLGEEISWGQRIFNIESFGVFQEHNLQNEINMHNFIDPQFLIGSLYPLFAITSIAILLFVWLNPRVRTNFFYSLFAPHPNLFFIFLAMLIISFFGGGGETFEQLLTLAIFFYSLRLYLCMQGNFKIPPKTNNSLS